MNLFTVTFEEDLERSLIQAYSIEKFVTNPHNYFILINEADDVCKSVQDTAAIVQSASAPIPE